MALRAAVSGSLNPPGDCNFYFCNQMGGGGTAGQTHGQRQNLKSTEHRKDPLRTVRLERSEEETTERGDRPAQEETDEGEHGPSPHLELTGSSPCW